MKKDEAYKITRYGMTIDLSKWGHYACPKCKEEGRDINSNNLMVYGLDSKTKKHKGAYCWSSNCTFRIPSEEYANGPLEQEYNVMGSYFDSEVNERLKRECDYDTKMYRKIRTETGKYFGVLNRYDDETGEIIERLYPCTQNYKISGYKVRTLPKDFSSPGPIGETGNQCELFGQFRFKSVSGRNVVIVGGEEDQQAAFQMLKDYADQKDYDAIPVVSPTTGENCVKQLQKNYEWLNRFDKIILCLDNDEAGKAATEAAALALPKGKVFVMDLSLKDPCEYLQQGESSSFINSYFKAKAFVPSGIVGSGDLMNKVMQNALMPKITLPPFMKKVEGLMAGGIPLGVIINLGSMSGAGKSTIIEECVYHWIFNCPYMIGIVSLESDCGQYGTKILSRHIGRKIDLIADSHEKIEYLQSEKVQAGQRHLFYKEDGSDRFMLIDERDGSLEDLKDKIEQLIIQCGCKVIILDPLQDILDGLSNEEQSVFMKWMKGMVKSHGVTFINVNHVRKSGSGQQANSTGADLHEEDFQGSSSIFKSAACNLLFTRNKEAEDPEARNTTKMKMTKCRWTGQTAPVAGMFYYDNETHKLWALEDWQAHVLRVQANLNTAVAKQEKMERQMIDVDGHEMEVDEDGVIETPSEGFIITSEDGETLTFNA